MEEKVNHVLVLQEGNVVQLHFPSSTSQTYSFEEEEEATQFVINCHQLEKFMEGIITEEKFDDSFKRFLSEYIRDFHVPIVSMEE